MKCSSLDEKRGPGYYFGKTKPDKVKKLRQKMEEYRFIHLDREHEQEINDKNAEFENVINSLDKERVINQGEISSLTNDKKN